MRKSLDRNHLNMHGRDPPKIPHPTHFEVNLADSFGEEKHVNNAITIGFAIPID